MLTSDQILTKVNEAIAAIQYPTRPAGLYEPIEYVLSIGGKRIRPVMLLLTAQALGTDINKVMPAAIGIETYHNYTLLHDDLMDRADMRRGMPTVHRKWDSNTAILSGDSMLVLACKHILSTRLPNISEAMDTFITTALEIGERQQYDMNFETRTDVTQDEYIEMIRLKTSVLIACAAKMGAILSGATPIVADQLYKYGEQIGLAFQLQDDLLDVYGDPKVFGKRIGGDILCNKKTFLLINAFQLANAQQLAELTRRTITTNYDEEQKIAAVTNIYNQLNIKTITADKINHYFMEAQRTLSSISLSPEGKQSLHDFALSLINRSY